MIKAIVFIILLLICMSIFAPDLGFLMNNISLGGQYLLKPMEIVFDLLGYTFSILLRQRFLLLFICIFLFIISFGIFLKIFIGNVLSSSKVTLDKFKDTYNTNNRLFKNKLSRIERIKRASMLKDLKASKHNASLKNKNKTYNSNKKFRAFKLHTKKKFIVNKPKSKANFTQRYYTKAQYNSRYTNIDDIEI